MLRNKTATKWWYILEYWWIINITEYIDEGRRCETKIVRIGNSLRTYPPHLYSKLQTLVLKASLGNTTTLKTSFSGGKVTLGLVRSEVKPK